MSKDGRREFVLRGERMRGGGGLRVTERCLVRQLLWLYPFPHFSHLNSLPLVRLPSPFVRLEPSLARLILDLELPFSCSGIVASGGPSVTAASVLAAAR